MRKAVCNGTMNPSISKLAICCVIAGLSMTAFTQSTVISTRNKTKKSGKKTVSFLQSSTTLLRNDLVELTLGLTPEGIPMLGSYKELKTGAVLFSDISDDPSLQKWIPESLGRGTPEVVAWKRTDDHVFFRAESECVFPDGLSMVRMVALDRESALIRLGMKVVNRTGEPVELPWFPGWNAAWNIHSGAKIMRYWEPLSFSPRQVVLTEGETKVLGSRLHSSDEIENGKNAYWVIRNEEMNLFFGLDWCGGWKAELTGIPGGLDFRFFLPGEESQLILLPGESIEGPAIMITPVSKTDEVAARAEWMKLRESLSARMYGGPAPSFPFSWNHWYTVRFGIDGNFLVRQLNAMDPYRFDYFVIDAGWYEACGAWTPHTGKFFPGEFESLLKQVKDKGVKPGIWSCPQFVKPGIEIPPGLLIDNQPGFYRPFIDGALADLDGSDFSAYLADHVGTLCTDYYARWWKYDQDFFVAETRAGPMKNVVALQEALKEVRRTFPDLYIESCQSGGRMLNEFTVLSSQTQWIRDGSRTGLVHARSNFQEALQAMEFLPPWAVLRWTNRPDENNQDDDEFTRMYCRSAMAGTWGVVADLPRIGERQRSVIIKEADQYRRLSELKYDCVYDILRPEEGSPAAGIIFYTADGSKAGLLFLRWDAKDAFNLPVSLTRLKSGHNYRIELVDTDEVLVLSGDTLRESGMTLPFSKTCMSFLVFIEAVE